MTLYKIFSICDFSLIYYISIIIIIIMLAGNNKHLINVSCSIVITTWEKLILHCINPQDVLREWERTLNEKYLLRITDL